MLLAIDPGTYKSAYVIVNEHDETIAFKGISDNEEVLSIARHAGASAQTVAIEKVASYGMAVGAEVFETVFWSGRFAEATTFYHETMAGLPPRVVRVTRKQVVTHLTGSAKAKDSNVRQAIIDRYGGSESIRKGGPLYGVSKDVWAALAVALYVIDGGETS